MLHVVDADPRSVAQVAIDEGWIHELRDGLTPREEDELLHRWSFWRRPTQTTPPGMGTTRNVWYVRAGRGAGKTRTGSEETRSAVERVPLIMIVGPTAGDVRDIIVEGESGIMSVFPADQRPHYEPSKLRITFHTGAVAMLRAGEEPDRLRGPQFYWGWFDEPASMPYGEEAWDNFEFGLRLGANPWALMTGTPKRRQWMLDLENEPTTIVTTGSTYDNRDNLSAVFIRRVIGKYENTRLGRQELHGQNLDDVEGALWAQAGLDRERLDIFDRDKPSQSLAAWLAKNSRSALVEHRQWKRVVAVDPPGETAECGIVCGMAPVGGAAGRDHAVVTDDYTISGRPEEWGRQVVKAFRETHARYVVVEANQGGDMVRSTVHAVDRSVPVRKIHASESKLARAEPVAALDAQGWVHHADVFPQLEDQMCTWVPNPKATAASGGGKKQRRAERGATTKSPDRLDARVHLIRDLLPDKEPPKVSHGRSAANVRIPRR